MNEEECQVLEELLLNQERIYNALQFALKACEQVHRDYKELALCLDLVEERLKIVEQKTAKGVSAWSSLQPIGGTVNNGTS